MGAQAAAQFGGGERSAVQAEAVTVLAGREAVGKDARQVAGGDAGAVVAYRYPDAAADLSYAQRHAFFRALQIAAGLPGVAHEVDEDLQHLVLLHADRRHFLEFADDPPLVLDHVAFIHAQAVLDQIPHVDDFGGARDPGVTLLHRDYLLDVVDVGAQ